MAGGQLAFERGQTLLLPPYTAYEYRSDPQAPASMIWAEFCGADSQRFVRYILAHNGPLFPAGACDAVTGLCMSLPHPPQADRMNWISCRLYEVFLALSQACTQAVLRQREGTYQILDYIDKHLGDTLTLNELSSVFEYSPAYFSRFFLRHTGDHYSQYLLRRRVERGRQLLSTDLSIEQLTHQLGFCDPSHFVRKFREVTGESPACYRRRHLG